METPMETTEDTCSTNGCPQCAKVAEESKQNEEMSLAFLLALIPVISLTFFGQMGLL